MDPKDPAPAPALVFHHVVRVRLIQLPGLASELNQSTDQTVIAARDGIVVLQ